MAWQWPGWLERLIGDTTVRQLFRHAGLVTIAILLFTFLDRIVKFTIATGDLRTYIEKLDEFFLVFLLSAFALEAIITITSLTLTNIIETIRNFWRQFHVLVV